MKRVFKVRDRYKGFFEVYRLKHNNRRKNDLIWVHWRDYLGKNENGITITKDEVKWLIQGLKEVLKTFNPPPHPIISNIKREKII